MDENALHQWFINCFGPVQGEMAFSQFNNLPEEMLAERVRVMYV